MNEALGGRRPNETRSSRSEGKQLRFLRRGSFQTYRITCGNNLSPRFISAATFSPMPLRVISGTAGGLHLKSPKRHALRPTQDRIRQVIFSSLAELVPGARVLDLYAGNGLVRNRGAKPGCGIGNLRGAGQRSRAMHPG